MKNCKTLLSLAVITLTTVIACQKDVPPVSVPKEIPTNCQGAPIDTIICLANYVPVCGCNNKTYSNACVAHSKGIKDYTQGVCK